VTTWRDHKQQKHISGGIERDLIEGERKAKDESKLRFKMGNLSMLRKFSRVCLDEVLSAANQQGNSPLQSIVFTTPSVNAQVIFTLEGRHTYHHTPSEKSFPKTCLPGVSEVIFKFFFWPTTGTLCRANLAL
jgi:hypothetical protein